MSCIWAIVMHIYWTVVLVLGTFKWLSSLRLLMLFKDYDRFVGI